MPSQDTCSVCPSPAKARGFCGRHYQIERRLGRITTRRPSASERFWSRVDKTPSCWVWTGTLYQSGYGHFKPVGKIPASVHRWAYEQLVGPIPAGLTLDHLCRVRRCVRPDHLEPVTIAENVLRGQSPPSLNRLKGRCPRCGGEYDRVKPNGWRECKSCSREARKLTYDRVNAARRAARLTDRTR